MVNQPQGHTPGGHSPLAGGSGFAGGPLVPIIVATHGLLTSPLSVGAVRGRLRIKIKTEIDKARGSGDSSALRKYVTKHELQQLLEREDEEIVQIIIAFMETQR